MKLAAHIKSLEALTDLTIPKSHYFVVRLDGCRFSKLTKKFLTKPFCPRMTQSMITTTCDLLKEFSSPCAFTVSDEISLLFLPCDEHQVHTYSGRVQKLTSVMASFAAVRFSQLMDFKEPIMFDARIIDCGENKQDAVNSIYWRHSKDGIRNGIMTIGLQHFSHKQLQNVKSTQVDERLKVLGVDCLRDFGSNVLGTFVKKEVYYLENVVDPRTGENLENVKRSRIRTATLDLRNVDENERNDLIVAKHWPESYKHLLNPVEQHTQISTEFSKRKRVEESE